MNTTRLLVGASWRRPLLSMAVAGLVLAGCAPMPSRQTTPPPAPEPESESDVRASPLQEPTVRQEQLPSASEREQQPSKTSPAVLALVTQADQRRRAGDLAGAQSTLERAVQIEPTNARLWLDLAQVRLAQNQPAQAEQLALRAVEHAADTETLSAAWSLVAKARRALGDEAGAREAEERAGGHSAALTRRAARA
ncbi:tetratricopeptide repeat protein [Guyparkeria hydrothermalis]|uniref:tetratricopeptide repeat protein n=1 Tax=Guyparkeria hydrothermalis TaxID=923 RepID=UPI0020226403|nr:tetratricopeptide repeat protein [Guyparkeria hydrothermalis]MCL7744425.1 tetratricopeptide repeat protein [Guyparkeria hydrothermalis]